MTGTAKTNEQTGVARDTYEIAKETRLWSLLAAQRESFQRDGAPSLDERQSDLIKLKRAILARRRDFEAAINADFGHRSAYETAIMEIMPTVQGIDFLRKNLRRWMRPRKRRVALQFRPGTAKVVLQPLGVVGIISPWNYPASLCLMPLATAIAAGNRAMLKPSEFTPKTSELIVALVQENFPEEQVAVVTGGSDVGDAFAALPFDHLVFTGSTAVGRAVMRAASANLVPVTLELGGKSPAIVDRGFSPVRAARSIAYGKLSNAGQTCIAPDYALVHESQVDAFVAAFEAAARAAYPAGVADDAYSAIISQRHHDRLTALIEDARRKGAKVLQIGAAPARRRPQAAAHAHRRCDAGDERHAGRDLRPDPADRSVQGRSRTRSPASMRSRDRSPSTFSATTAVSSSRSSIAPRAAMRRSTTRCCTTRRTTCPSAASVPSGIGAYHGEEGFLSLSHAKGVFTQSRWSFAGLIRAPFGRSADSSPALLPALTHRSRS